MLDSGRRHDIVRITARYSGRAVCMLRGLGSRMTLTMLLICTTLISPVLQVRAAPVSGNLLQALSTAPAGSTLYFTDWDLLRRYKGVPNLNSKSPLAARLHFLISLSHGQALMSAYGLNYSQRQAKDWSWDSTDLAWESNPNFSGSIVYVLAFRPGFDLAPVVAHFKQRHFTLAMYHGTPIYSHDMTVTSNWLTEFAVLNTAVLADRRMLVLSHDPGAVHMILDVIRKSTASLANDAAARGAASALGATGAAVVMPGPDACSAFGDSALLASVLNGGIANSDALRKQIAALQKLLSQLHMYGGYALGYHYEGKRPIVLLTLHYPDAASARADLALRKSIATTGLSLTDKRPYSAILFTVAGALVQGSDMTLRLRPLHDEPQPVFNMIFQRDMLFAACP